MKLIHKTIAIKRRINITDDLKDFIFTNINYRRKVYNDFVEESRKYENLKDFNPIKYKTTYYNEIEKPNNVYDKYCVGISEQVAKDIKFAKKSMKGNKTLETSKLKFKKFDPFYGSFKVHSKSYFHGENNIHASKILVMSDDLISFRVRKKERMLIKLKERIFDDSLFTDNIYPFYVNKKQQYVFTNDDIKEISFIHENGKFFIVLFTNVYYYRLKDEISNNKCGIDLGIHNPIMLYDGNKNISFRMSYKKIKRIAYLERRARRLQKILDNKLIVNNHYISNNRMVSKNYRKVQRKLRVTWKKIFNIRLDWRRKISLYIAKHYNLICVDKFSQPDITVHKKYKLSKNAIKRINFSNRNHAMTYFYKSFKHNVKKYNGKIIKSPKNTTRTCSCCGHINEKLPLTKRYLYCTKCGSIIERDVNAAINCYNFI